jgi:hypothetical protein
MSTLSVRLPLLVLETDQQDCIIQPRPLEELVDQHKYTRP